MATIPRDSDWVKNSFLMAAGRMQEAAVLRRYRRSSSADFKYTGAGFGMSTCLNMPPQFTPFADPRRAGLWNPGDTLIKSKGVKKKYFQGQGIAYSEMLDDNKQIAYIRAGVTQYKGMLTFFTGFYDNNSALLARQGRASLAYYFGLVVGTLGTLFLQPFVLGFKILGYLMGRTSSSYMSLKPAMPLYWSRVNVLMNTFGANLGVIPRFLENTGAFDGNADAFGNSATGGGEEYRNEIQMLSAGSASGESYKQAVKYLLPDIMAKDGTLNVLKAVSEAARRQKQWEERVSKLGNFPNSKEGLAAMMAYLEKPLLNNGPMVDLEKYLKIYHGGILGSMAERGRDGDGIGDTLEGVARTGDSEQLAAINAAAKSQTEGDGGGTTNTGETGVTTTDTASAATQSAVNNTSSFTATSSGDPNTTGVPMIFTNTPEQVASRGGAAYTAATAGVTGVDESSLRDAVFGKREAEMNTVVMGKDNVPTDAASRQALADSQSGTAVNLNAEKSFYQIVTGWMSNAKEALAAGWDNGYEFVALRVNYTGAGTMSLSNSTKETTISGTLKGVSSTSRDSRISLSDFKTGFAFIDGVTNMVRDVFSGAMDSVSMGGIMALAGNAFIDFPKQWDDSSATVPTANLSIELRSPYGNVIASYLNLYTTIAAILALGVPLSTGPQSYTAPFVLEAYCQGVFAIRYGMINSITIRHGTGNLGFAAADHRPLGFDIDLEIGDLSSVYHAAITNGMSPINIFKRVTDDDNLFTDYLTTITAIGLSDMVDTRRKAAIRMAAQWSNVKSFWTPEHIVSRLVYGNAPMQSIKRLFGSSTYGA